LNSNAYYGGIFYIENGATGRLLGTSPKVFISKARAVEGSLAYVRGTSSRIFIQGANTLRGMYSTQRAMLIAEDGAQFWWTDSKIESVLTG
jgi:hypothetical protein